MPWYVFKAINYLEKILFQNAIVFEYGSGGSTLFFAERAKKVISLEHDSFWSERIKEILLKKNIKNVTYITEEPEHKICEIPNSQYSDIYHSSKSQYKGYTFKNYVSIIQRYPDEYFDLIAIDGRARSACITHARKKVKKGGFILLDNSDRPQYREAIDLMKKFRKFEFVGPGPCNRFFWTTTIWQKS